MPTYNVHEAKTQLSKLIERAEAGEEVVIARAGKPAVRLVPAAPAEEGPRVFGQWAGLGFSLPDDFDAWTPELEDMFFGEEASRKWEALMPPQAEPDA